jgi:C-8 sterol isomerase
MGFVSFLAKLAVAAVAFAVFCAVVDRPEHWVFDPATLKAVAGTGVAAAQRAHGGNASSSQVIQAVVAEVNKAYPKWTGPTNKWMWNNAGGAMGSMSILHFSLTEYLIIFGTAVGTEGHTGRFMAEDFFTIIVGEQWAYEQDSQTRETYRVGDQHHLTRGGAKQYRAPGELWALEYARGNMLSMLPFGVMDTLFSTLDLETWIATCTVAGEGVIKHLLMGKI